MAGFEAGIATRVGNTQIPVKRILGRNPGPMTGPGTNSYLIGENTLCLIDPGPVDEVQLENFIAAIGSAELRYILVTHTHGDHSPGAAALHAATGAELVGMPAPDSYAQDRSFQPSMPWAGGDIIQTDEYSIEMIHTPGHVSNHICYLLQEEEFLFTGDHVLEGTTSVILPPDGDMGDYLNSLAYLKTRSLKIFGPGHGELMNEPQAELDALIAHRLKREQKIVDCLRATGPIDIDKLVLSVYDDVASHLIPWAKKTMLAHLIKLQRDGRAELNEPLWQLSG